MLEYGDLDNLVRGVNEHTTVPMISQHRFSMAGDLGLMGILHINPVSIGNRGSLTTSTLPWLVRATIVKARITGTISRDWILAQAPGLRPSIGNNEKDSGESNVRVLDGTNRPLSGCPAGQRELRGTSRPLLGELELFKVRLGGWLAVGRNCTIYDVCTLAGINAHR